MGNTFGKILPPLISLALIMLGQGFFNTFVSVLLASEGFSTTQIGVVNACYYAGLMIGSIYIENLINRIGHIRSFAILAAINAAGVCLQSAALSIWSWSILRFIVGTSVAGLFIVIESWLLLLSTKKSRGRLLSFYMVALYASQGAGQYILSIINLESSAPFLTSVFLSAISLIPVCVMRSGAPQLTENPSFTNIFHILRISPIGVLGCFVAGMILSSFYSLGPVFAKTSQFSTQQISQIMGLTIFGGLALQWPIGHLSDIFNRLTMKIIVTIIIILISISLFFSPYVSYPFLLVLFILFGGFSFTLYPLSISYTSDFFSSHKIMSVTCALLVVFSTGSIFGPLIAPIPMDMTGPSGLFLYVAVLSSLLLIAEIIRKSKAAPITEEEQGEYIPLPRTTPLAFYLDPRIEDKDEDALEEYIFESDED